MFMKLTIRLTRVEFFLIIYSVYFAHALIFYFVLYVHRNLFFAQLYCATDDTCLKFQERRHDANLLIFLIELKIKCYGELSLAK